MAAIAGRLAEFLAEDPVSGALTREELADGEFGIAIGDGDGGPVGFQLDGGPGVVEGHDHFTRNDRRPPGDLEQLGKLAH